jgi:hypothetical protein
MPSDQTPDFQERTSSSLNQKTSHLDPWQSLLVVSKGITDTQDQQSSTDAQRNNKKDNDHREHQNLIYPWAANHARISDF